MKHTHIDDNNNNNKYRKFSSKQTYREGGENEICWILMKFCRLFSQHKVHSVFVLVWMRKSKISNWKIFDWKGFGLIIWIDFLDGKEREKTYSIINWWNKPWILSGFLLSEKLKNDEFIVQFDRDTTSCVHIWNFEILKFQFYFLFFLFCFQFEWMWTQSGTRSTRTHIFFTERELNDDGGGTPPKDERKILCEKKAKSDQNYNSFIG